MRILRFTAAFLLISGTTAPDVWATASEESEPPNKWAVYLGPKKGARSQGGGDFAKEALDLRERAIRNLDDPISALNMGEVGTGGGSRSSQDKKVQKRSKEKASNQQYKQVDPRKEYAASQMADKARDLFKKGDYAKARELYERALEITGEMSGSQLWHTVAWIERLGAACCAMGDYTKAVELQERALAVREKLCDRWHPVPTENLRELAVSLGRIGDYARALELGERALAIREKDCGPDDQTTVETASDLAVIYSDMGDYAKARELGERALNVTVLTSDRGPDGRLVYTRKKVHPQHTDMVPLINNLAVIYRRLGEYAKARELGERAMAIGEKVDDPQQRIWVINALGPQHPITAASINNLAVTYSEMADYTKALELGERALAVRERVLGAQHPDTAASINYLAATYRAMGDYTKALELGERALAIRERVLGAQHPDTAGSINNLAATYRAMGDYTKALELGERALAIRERVLGAQHPDTAGSINNLAATFSDMSDFAKALELQERALAIREKVLGAQHPDTAGSINDLAVPYREMGDYAKALELQERALAIREKVLGPQHPDTAASINDLAASYREMGDYAKARELGERALAIREKVLGPQHPDTAISINSLAVMFSEMGDYTKALELGERALANREKVLGSQHPLTVAILSNLGEIYRAMGDRAKARDLQERALAIREKVLGPQHLDTAASLLWLSATHCEMGDYVKARELQERALAIREKVLGSQHLDTAASLLWLAATHCEMGDYVKARELQERALAIREKVLGPQHPLTAATLSNLAHTDYLMGDMVSARSCASRASAARDRQLQSMLKMDEKFRLTWQKTKVSFDLFASVLRPEQLAQLVLRWKGVVLDSLLEDRALALAFSKDPNASEQLNQLQALRSRLAEAAFDQNKKEEAEKLAEQIGAIQREMASRSAGLGRVRANADLTIDSVAPSLLGGCVYVDFIQFADLKIKGDEGLSYGAIILNEEGSPVLVRIPKRKMLEQSIDELIAAVKSGDERTVKKSIAILGEELWKPVAEKLPAGTQRIIICPDGKLSFVPFAALMDGKEKFVCEKYLVSYVASGRDLARTREAKSNRNITLFADPEFDSSGTRQLASGLAMRSGEVSAFGEIQLPRLPGTAAECQTLKETAMSTGWNPTVYVGREATEQQVRSIKNTGILHLATHGFYLNAFTPAPDNSRGMSVAGIDETSKPGPQNIKAADPMRASGIALAGAQATLKAWNEGKCPDPENDGILTAEEVAGLNLDGTWIVTLSACETGIGEARSGEGVFGLRRAFMMAGAQNLVMTLWPVNDTSTGAIMADFYKRCFATGDAARSLSETQRDWLVQIKKEKGLLAAVRDAGPFVIATTGKPSTKVSVEEN